MADSNIYDRTIAIYRIDENLQAGVVEYAGVDLDRQIPIFSGIQASVQVQAGSARPRAGDLPSAPPAPIQWEVYIPENLIAEGLIMTGDIVVDDLDRQFQISASDCHFMGWTLFTIRLEAH